MHKYLSKKDRIFKKLVKEIGILELPKPQKTEPYAALMRSIAYQQLHGKAAATIFGRFLDLYDSPFPTPEQVLKTKPEKLRAVGFSASKVAAILDIAKHAAEGVVPSLKEAKKLSNEELIARLTQIRGVGKWTVEMFLIFTLAREDVFPIDDFGVRNGYRIAASLPEMPTPKELRTIGEPWAPYRTLASLYLWRAADMSKESKKEKS